MNFYMVVYDRKPLPQYRAFHEAFVEHPDVRKWWHYIKSCYLVKTHLTANQLSDHFTTCAKQVGISTTHLVMKVDPADRQGMLIKDAWEWMKHNAPRAG